MTAENSLGSAEEREAARLLNQADAIVRMVPADIPKGFASALFGRTVPEDLLKYQPSELAKLSVDAWAAMAKRAPGATKIRCELPRAHAEARQLKSIAVLEIVNDNMPFLVDSVLSELNERGLNIDLVAHPIFALARDEAGNITSYKGPATAGDDSPRESLIHIHLARIDSDAQRHAIVQAIEALLNEVRLSVADWRPMLERVHAAIAEIKANPPPLPVEDLAEAIQFLEWLLDDNFTFLGVRDYVLTTKHHALEPMFETGLGIMRSREMRVLQRGGKLLDFTPEIMAFLKEPRPLIITKAGVRSRVHRRVYLDYVGVKRFDSEGRLVGEFRIVGLLTSTAYTRSIRSIPHLRRKIAAVLERARFDAGSHSGKALANVLEHYARDELFQIDEDTLYTFAMAILQLDERPRVRVLPRIDLFERFVSVMVYVPRERYDSRIRAAIGDYLAKTYKGRVSAFYPFFPEGPLVRVHFIIGRQEGATPKPDRTGLERAIESIVRTWTDVLQEAMEREFDPGKANELTIAYRDAFSRGFQDAYSAASAIEDIRTIETLRAENQLAVDFHAREGSAPHAIGLKVWSCARPIPLSERVPVLENMGFCVVDERTYRITPQVDAHPVVWLHDMTLERVEGEALNHAAKNRLEDCFLAVMRDEAENDGYNALVLASPLAWREVALIRALSRYLRQIRVPFSQDYMWATLAKHAGLAAKIVELFACRFEPGPESTPVQTSVGAMSALEEVIESGARASRPVAPVVSKDDRAQREAAIFAEIESALTSVESLDEDRIVSHFVNVVQAAIRTNFYQRDDAGYPKAQIAIKFASGKIEGMPLPHPLYEIFVYSPRVEGVHLRFGKVARGGIRWSDRPQDFRTEVLGLVKAQQVKNAVIVPVGAKGGFVPKRLPVGGPREAIQAEGIATYKLFIGTLLDITDNIGPAGLIPSPTVVRHEGDDPYLVVAADKGTATFSDTANDISRDHDFWLGDAFASGGSAGYDHKKMGITARGAWEAVKRHFREMDIDIGKTPFTVAGVGDMSGDVFGNGMLRENTINLVAAFDHRDIFIDPDPDPEKSLAERRRLFDLPRSSWKDYDRELISPGGGIFPRSAKDIPLTPEMQAVLGMYVAHARPQAVIQAILKMQVDLLWFGGIGTYVRAADESDETVGDRANDAIRVAGAELNCKVIGEGANLGMTQRGRVEAAQRGIRLNTDAIDNSAGVNTSDVEVNIKIALSAPVRDGTLTNEARNELLGEMTGEVARLVLRNNYQQTLALSLAERRGLDNLGFQQRLMQILEQRGELVREVEFLPDEVELEERRRRSLALTRPELAMLLGYAKLTLYSDLLDSTVPDDPYLGRELNRYFPNEMTEQFPEALQAHRLRREIIATQLTNSMINRGGATLIVRIADQTGAAPAAIAAAFAAVRNSYDLIGLHVDIEALDNKVASEVQLELFIAVQDLLLDRIVWFLRNVDLSQGLAGVIDHYRAGIDAVEASLDDALTEEANEARAARRDELVEACVPQALAQRIANLPALTAAPDIVLVAERTGKSVAVTTATYFAAGAYFCLDQVIDAARIIKVSDYFDRLALDRSLDSIGEAERRLTAAMVMNGTVGTVAVEGWVAEHGEHVERVRMAIHEIASTGLTLSKLAVTASLLGDLAKG